MQKPLKLPPPRETDIQRDILQALAWERDVEFFRNNTGALPGPNGHLVFYGLGKGSSDLIGILAPSGRLLALEVKRPGEKPTASQLIWQARIRDLGGFACVVDSVESARAALERARKGERQ